MKPVPFVLQLLLLSVLRPECGWALPVAIRTSYPSKNIQERFSLNCGEGTFLCQGSLSFIQKKWTLVFGFPGGSVVKNLPANAGDTGSIPGWGRSPGEGNGNPLQCSCLENPMDRGAWWLQSMGRMSRTKQQQQGITFRERSVASYLQAKPSSIYNMTLGFIPVSGLIKRKE